MTERQTNKIVNNSLPRLLKDYTDNHSNVRVNGLDLDKIHDDTSLKRPQ